MSNKLLIYNTKAGNRKPEKKYYQRWLLILVLILGHGYISYCNKTLTKMTIIHEKLVVAMRMRDQKNNHGQIQPTALPSIPSSGWAEVGLLLAGCITLQKW